MDDPQSNTSKTQSTTERARGERVEALLAALEDIPLLEHEGYLEAVCPDPEMRRDVLSLSSVEPKSNGYLDRFVGVVERLTPKQPAPPDLTNQRVGAYRLLRLLGRGGMGEVYEAERADGAFEQRVALKLLTSAHSGTEAHDRFLAERRILAQLKHPAIAHIVDGGVTADGTPWFAMEHIEEGEPIDAWCARLRHDVRKRLALFLQVCDAVDHAHHRLVVHRDLKPANVLVTGDGQIKLLDFGIAQLLKPDQAEETDTSSGATSRLMTPEYASPEQVRGEPVTTASDVYQLGLLLYQLWSGQRPPSWRQQTSSRQSEIHEWLNTQKPHSDLKIIVEKALCQDPDQRYGSADRMAQDIRRYLEDRPIAARKATWLYHGRKFLQRHALGVSATVVGLTLVAGMTVFHTARIQGERDRAEIERERAQIERNRAQAEATKAQQMSAFLAGMIRSVDPREARGEEVTVREALDRGAEQVDLELAGQPGLQADMLQVLGRTYTELGLYDSAERLLTRSLKLRRSHLGTVHPDFGEALGGLGRLRELQGDYTGARELLTAASSILETSLGDDPSELTEVLRILGVVHWRLEQREDSRAAFERALAVESRVSGKKSEQVAHILNDLANLFADMGELHRAQTLFEQALTILEQELGANHPRVGNTLMNLAGSLQYQGKFEGVETMFRRSLAIREGAYGTNHFRVGMALNNLGNFLTMTGRNDEAIEVLQRGLNVYRAALGSEHLDVGYPLSSLGDAHFTAGHLHEARDYYREAVTIRVKSLGMRPFDLVLAHSLVRLGHIEAELGNTTEAQRTLNRASEVWRGAPENVHVQLIPTMLSLSRWLVEQQRCEEATPLLVRIPRTQTTQQLLPEQYITELQNLENNCSEQLLTPSLILPHSGLRTDSPARQSGEGMVSPRRVTLTPRAAESTG